MVAARHLGAMVATLLCRAALGDGADRAQEAGDDDRRRHSASGSPDRAARSRSPLIALRLVWRASPELDGARDSLRSASPGGPLRSQYPGSPEGLEARGRGSALVLVGTALGGPIFALLGGVAVLLFLRRRRADRRHPGRDLPARRSRPRSRRFRSSRSPASCSPKATRSQRLLRRVPRAVRLGAGRHRRSSARDGVRVLHRASPAARASPSSALGGLLLPGAASRSGYREELLARSADRIAARSGCCSRRRCR